MLFTADKGKFEENLNTFYCIKQLIQPLRKLDQVNYKKQFIRNLKNEVTLDDVLRLNF